MNTSTRTRSQESTRAIERLYITMRHLFNRGFYKPGGVSGETLRESLLLLRPEIYGSIAEERTELNGLIYVIERLPEGIEECQFINLTADEGYQDSHFTPIIPAKRRRNCYRIDRDQMNIEITRGRSEIYDILTHLTFLFIESHKIKDRILIDEDENAIREWNYLKEVVLNNKKTTKNEHEVLLTHVATILGRTFDEVQQIHKAFATAKNPNKFFSLIFWLGQLALNETLENKKRTITFSSTLRDSIGHHIYGEVWANKVKKVLEKEHLINRPIHIISANMHSVMNSIYAPIFLSKESKEHAELALFELLSNASSTPLQKKVKEKASNMGLTYIKDTSGTNINVQVIDTAKIDFKKSNYIKKHTKESNEMPIIIVMDYAFGEQAFETMDELLKPFICDNNKEHFMNVESVSIMGKAGILEGGKSDIMIPSAHIFEGTADNYPFKNELEKKDLEGFGVDVFEGTMVTVLGTSLQNKNILEFFHDSTWHAIGLEMEGAHYQKAIQSASKIRGNISENVKVRYAYYASDNPLETGSTLASGGLGTSGVRPTYAITQKILEQIFNQNNMSKENIPSDEVDLGNLFKIIGKGIQNLFDAVGSVFARLFHYLILFLLFIRNNAIKLGLALIIGAGLGLYLDLTKSPVYSSMMIVEPNFKSTQQLYNNIDFYHELVQQNDTVELAKSLNISTTDASKLKGFYIEPIKNENEKYEAFSQFMKEIDSGLVENISIKNFKKGFSNFDYKHHQINIKSTNSVIFNKLGAPIINSIENNIYYKNLKKINDQNFIQNQQVLVKSLSEIDTLRKIYNEVLITEANKMATGTSITLAQGVKKTEEVELFNESLKLNEELIANNRENATTTDILNVVSTFSEIGIKERSTYKKYTFRIGALFFALVLIVILLKQLNTYLITYKK